MNKRKENLEAFKASLGKGIVSKEAYIEAQKVPEPTHQMLSGTLGYKIEDRLHFLTILNTYLIQDTFYKSKSKFLSDFRELIEKLAIKDPEFVVKAIIYSRCKGSGLRAITQLGAVLALPFIKGTTLAEKLFRPYSKTTGKGGIIYRPDDMVNILSIYKALGGKGVMPNSMKKGFRKAIESFDTYTLLKYKKAIIDISNIVHPNPHNSSALVEVEGKTIPTISAILTGESVKADTWETGLSEVDQIVKEYASEGEREKALKEGKTLIFKDLLESNSLGYLALLRNIRNILDNDTQGELLDLLCKRIEDYERIRKAKIMPHQILNAFLNTTHFKVVSALNNALNKSTDNFRETITGKTAVLLDVSGSMYDCKNEASAIAAILNIGLKESAFFTFDSICRKVDTPYRNFLSAYRKYLEGFRRGGTNIPNALSYTLRQEETYDRIIIISDNESTKENCRREYQKIIKSNPNIKIYSVDLLGYGESSLPIDGRINLYFGKTFKLFDDMILSEFNPNFYIEEVNKLEL